MENDRLEMRSMVESDRDALAELIHRSTNAWYRANRGHDIFGGPVSDCRIFPDTYRAVDNHAGIVVVDTDSGNLVGSCFLHPRPTHIGVGIVNVAPEAFGRGVARRMIEEACRLADETGGPIRLVSSAMNLDSYSLYTRAGFVPRALHQDMMVPVPEGGLPTARPVSSLRIRPAVPDEVEALATFEQRVAGIRRDVDLAHWISNPTGIWRVWVAETASGALCGWLACSDHDASRIAGPGAMDGEATAAALVWTALDALRGKSTLVLVPSQQQGLVRAVADWGGRNVELHVQQVRGSWTPVDGVHLASFLPESG